MYTKIQWSKSLRCSVRRQSEAPERRFLTDKRGIIVCKANFLIRAASMRLPSKRMALGKPLGATLENCVRMINQRLLLKHAAKSASALTKFHCQDAAPKARRSVRFRMLIATWWPTMPSSLPLILISVIDSPWTTGESLNMAGSGASEFT